MEGVAEAGLERGAIECRRPYLDGQLLEPSRDRPGHARDEVPSRPPLERRILEWLDGEVAPRTDRR
jgi:hypothetical protein